MVVCSINRIIPDPYFDFDPAFGVFHITILGHRNPPAKILYSGDVPANNVATVLFLTSLFIMTLNAKCLSLGYSM